MSLTWACIFISGDSWWISFKVALLPWTNAEIEAVFSSHRYSLWSIDQSLLVGEMFFMFWKWDYCCQCIFGVTDWSISNSSYKKSKMAIHPCLSETWNSVTQLDCQWHFTSLPESTEWFWFSTIGSGRIFQLAGRQSSQLFSWGF